MVKCCVCDQLIINLDDTMSYDVCFECHCYKHTKCDKYDIETGPCDHHFSQYICGVCHEPISEDWDDELRYCDICEKDIGTHNDYKCIGMCWCQCKDVICCQCFDYKC